MLYVVQIQWKANQVKPTSKPKILYLLKKEGEMYNWPTLLLVWQWFLWSWDKQIQHLKENPVEASHKWGLAVAEMATDSF